MAWLRKKPDPISQRAQVLTEEIARLEAEIQQLDAQVQRGQPQPRLRSTTLPHGATVSHPPPASTPAPLSHQEPIFEEVGPDLLEGRPESGATPEHFNELGVRKYDLPALLRRLRHNLRGPSTTNPKLVNYLAAGSIQGLRRPLRFEKRLARNRFIFFFIILFLALLGTLLVFLKGHR